MATFSITQNVTIQDAKVAEKIKEDLKTAKPAFPEIKPCPLKDNTQKVVDIWFKH